MYKLSEWYLLSWITKCCSNFNYSNSEFLFSSNVTSLPTLSFLVKMHFIFLANLKNRADTTNTFFKLLKCFQSIIFPIPNSSAFFIEKAVTVNLVLNFSIPTSGGILAGIVSKPSNFYQLFWSTTRRPMNQSNIRFYKQQPQLT